MGMSKAATAILSAVKKSFLPEIAVNNIYSLMPLKKSKSVFADIENRYCMVDVYGTVGGA